jgi:hypothetical protein
MLSSHIILCKLGDFNGILIFTTDRVDIFDEAFKSRVQLALAYSTLHGEGIGTIYCGIGI